MSDSAAVMPDSPPLWEETPARPMATYIPADWYWKRSDGMYWSSARLTFVNAGDKDYRDWLEADLGRTPSAYPRDAAGAESVDALAEALAPYPDAFASLADYVSSLRYAAEVAGIEVGGMQIATDRESQGLINGAYNLVGAKPDMTIRFNVGGKSTRLDSAAVHIVAIAVGEHVQACREREGDVLDAIEAGTIKTRAEALAAFTAV